MKILHKIAPIAVIACLVLVIGSPDAIDAGRISFTQGMLQMVGGLAAIAAILRAGRCV